MTLKNKGDVQNLSRELVLLAPPTASSGGFINGKVNQDLVEYLAVASFQADDFKDPVLRRDGGS